MLKRIYLEFFEDRIPSVAGGITFFIFLAIFPGIAAIVSVYGMIADRASIARDIDLLSDFLPGGAISVLRTELHRLILQKPSTLNFTFLFTSIVALWSASGGFSALIEGLNIGFEVRETRSFFRLTINALLFTVVAIVFGVIGIFVGVLIPAATDQGFIPHILAIFIQLLMWPVSFLVSTILISLIYHYGPDRKDRRFRWLDWGSAISAGLWLLSTRLFSLYVEYFGSYDRVYGDLGAIVGFLTWVWISIVLLLLGAEINCELDRGKVSVER